MKKQSEIKTKLAEIEKEVSGLRSNGIYGNRSEHIYMTEQMATLRWVLDSKSAWDEAGLRDT
jgi:hypothetical protein